MRRDFPSLQAARKGWLTRRNLANNHKAWMIDFSGSDKSNPAAPALAADRRGKPPALHHRPQSAADPLGRGGQNWDPVEFLPAKSPKWIFLNGSGSASGKLFDALQQKRKQALMIHLGDDKTVALRIMARQGTPELGPGLCHHPDLALHAREKCGVDQPRNHTRVMQMLIAHGVSGQKPCGDV